MTIIPDPLSFDWDSGNIHKNLKKHKVSCQEAKEVFNNQPLLINQDQKHSLSEIRLQALGVSNNNRHLFLSLTIRNKKIRIMSVRDVNLKEKKIYEKA